MPGRFLGEGWGGGAKPGVKKHPLTERSICLSCSFHIILSGKGGGEKLKEREMNQKRLRNCLKCLEFLSGNREMCFIRERRCYLVATTEYVLSYDHMVNPWSSIAYAWSDSYIYLYIHIYNLEFARVLLQRSPSSSNYNVENCSWILLKEVNCRSVTPVVCSND